MGKQYISAKMGLCSYRIYLEDIKKIHRAPKRTKLFIPIFEEDRSKISYTSLETAKCH